MLGYINIWKNRRFIVLFNVKKLGYIVAKFERFEQENDEILLMMEASSIENIYLFLFYFRGVIDSRVK